MHADALACAPRNSATTQIARCYAFWCRAEVSIDHTNHAHTPKCKTARRGPGGGGVESGRLRVARKIREVREETGDDQSVRAGRRFDRLRAEKLFIIYNRRPRYKIDSRDRQS